MFFLEADFSEKNKYLEKFQNGISIVRKDNNIKNLNKIYEPLEKLFNCEVYLAVEVNDKMYDAYTYTVTDLRLKTTNDKNGFKFKNKNVELFIVITSGLLWSDEFSDREIGAILLHEVGHNFNNAINNTYNISTKDDSKLIKDLIRTKRIVKGKNEEKDEKTVDTALRVMINIDPDFINKIFNSIKTLVSGSINSIADMVSNFTTSFFHYNDREEFADEFAASYGYREDLTSALLKLNKYNSELNPVVKLDGTFEYIMSYIFGLVLFGPLFVSTFLTNLNFEAGIYKRIYALIDNYNAEVNNTSLPKDKKKIYLKKSANIKKLVESLEKDIAFNQKNDPLHSGTYFAKLIIVSNIGKAANGNEAYELINTLDKLGKK